MQSARGQGLAVHRCETYNPGFIPNHFYVFDIKIRTLIFSFAYKTLNCIQYEDSDGALPAVACRKKSMNRLLTTYCKALDAASALCMAVMVVLVFGNVVLRYFFSTGLLISEEISRWLFVWMVFMGAVVVMRERGHMGTDMVIARLPVKAQRLCLVVAQVMMLYITWLMLTGSWGQVMVNRETEAPVSGLSVAIFYFAGVLFAASTLLILIHQIWLTVSGRLSDSELVVMVESEESAHLVLPPTTGASTDERQ